MNDKENYTVILKRYTEILGCLKFSLFQTSRYRVPWIFSRYEGTILTAMNRAEATGFECLQSMHVLQVITEAIIIYNNYYFKDDREY